MPEIRRALISVYDKRGLVDLARGLRRLGIEIISSGGTASLLRDSGLEVIEVSDYTGFPEVMNGRVKTLHPKIHGGLLAIRDNTTHLRQMKELGINPIDMLVVNLYPFEETIARKGATMEEAIENIDVGGPAMIRAAAKNHKYVAVVVDPAQYSDILKELEENSATLSETRCQELATRAFGLTAHYDKAIADFFSRMEKGPFPNRLHLEFVKKQDLRYGENPHQSAAFYLEEGAKGPCVANLEQLSGKELSFNNILDMDAALELVKEFEGPSAVVIKHTNPCGAGCAESLSEAFRRAYGGDPISAFGCVIGLNRSVDLQTAEEIASPGHFVEAVVAPDYASEALKVIKEKRKWGADLRILRSGPLGQLRPEDASLDLKRVVGGLLTQTRDITRDDFQSLKVVTTRQPTQEELRDLRFAWIVAKHVKSNAIVLAKGETLVGVGAGQMSRVDSVEIALRKAGARAGGSVMASDAFFPFRDSIDLAARGGIRAVIQPGGSNKDADVIKAAEEHGIAMVFTGRRHFRH